MTKVLLGPLPAVRSRARLLAGEVHERVFRRVMAGENFVTVLGREVPDAYCRWCETEERDVAELALDYASSTLALRDRIVEARDRRKKIGG